MRRLPIGESVILTGPVGEGETHVAQGLGHLASRQGPEVRFTKTSRLLASRRWSRRPDLGQTAA
ncbi:MULTISPECIES: ATP-binding protein [Nocardia]|uniref:ATP-binding protein n=1 Tax=Nocardia TaxID=1817 RepID=UPI0024901375|nr:ATP-binding protein [Nocardia sputorum]